MQTKPTAQELKALYQAGLSLNEIARKLGFSFGAIRNWMIRFDIPYDPKKRVTQKSHWDDKREEFVHLYFDLDKSIAWIAEYFGVTFAAAYKAMKRLNLKPFGRGRRKGKNHHQFKHGKSSVLYRKVITKDKCRKCETTEDLGIHHKNDDHYDNRLENLEVLCNSCHMSETKRKWWEAKRAGLPLPKSNAPMGWTRKKKKKRAMKPGEPPCP